MQRGTVSVLMGQVDARFEHVRADGSGIVCEPVDQKDGYREYSDRRHAEGRSLMKALESRE